VFVDTSRLARVAAWDPSWSERSPAQLQRALALRRPAPHFTGTQVTVQLSDIALRSATGVRSTLQLQYVDDRGEQTDVSLGAVRNGPSDRLTAPVERCARQCAVEQLYVSGSSSSVSDVQGALTIDAVAVDGHRVDWGLADPGGWRPARPFPVSLVDPPVVLSTAGSGLRLQLYLGRLPGAGPQLAQVSGFARITPSRTPDVVPALVTRGTATDSAAQQGSGIALDYPASAVVGTSLNGEQVPMRVVERVRALPGLGDEGSLSDLETALVEFEPPLEALVTTELWVARDTPPSVLTAIRARGISLTDPSAPSSLAATLHGLRTDAFSLGLRLFLVVGIATLLLAVLGVFTSAVLQSRWRSYEVASLRVVGVSQRTLVRGSVLEYTVLLGVAVLLGMLSAYLALRLVLPSMSLGTSAEHDPSPVYATHWGLILSVGAALFLLATAMAVVVSRRITRLGRPSTLRWAEQG
jgi:putative ABC transport system permease protein